jgi:hypothetical protein
MVQFWKAIGKDLFAGSGLMLKSETQMKHGFMTAALLDNTLGTSS